MNASCESLNDRRESLFAAWFKPHRQSRSVPRSRKLRIEALESRLALAAAPLAADVSLADYLAQTPEMGPHLPPVAETGGPTAPALDQALIEAADALAATLPAVPEELAEGESVSPQLLTFHVTRIDGGFVRLHGTLTDDDMGMVNVSFGDLFAGTNAMSDSYGYYSEFVIDPGFGGTVTARAMDGEGNWSNTMTQILV